MYTVDTGLYLRGASLDQLNEFLNIRLDSLDHWHRAGVSNSIWPRGHIRDMTSHKPVRLTGSKRARKQGRENTP